MQKRLEYTLVSEIPIRSKQCAFLKPLLMLELAMSPIELGGEPLIIQDFELSFQYESNYIKPYTLLHVDKSAAQNDNQPFMHFELE